MQNYLPKTYEAAATNFGVTQNNDGLIFVANVNGILIFDGITWDRCYTKNQAAITSIAKTSKGEIAVGTIDGDIGFVSKNKTGTFKYHSLLDSIPENKRPHEIIRQIVTIGKSTYFLSSDKLIEYTAGNIKLFEPKESFHARLLVMGKHLFVSEINKHFSVLINGKLVPIENTENLSSEKFFYCYPLSASNYAVGFRNIGTYIALYDSLSPTTTRFEKKESPCDKELLMANANNGCLLSNGNYIVTTNLKGAFEINKDLQIIYRYNSSNGIYDDNIKSAFEDVNGNLWLSLYYGVSFVEINSNLFKYSRSNGITGVVQSAAYYKDELFIATDKGVQVYNREQEKFVSFRDFNKQTWFLYPHKNKLFIASDKGLFIYDNKTISKLSENKTLCLLSDPYQPDMLYAGTDQGLEIYWIKNNQVTLVTTYQLNREISSLAYDSRNNIYFTSSSQDVFFLNSRKSFELDSIKDKSELVSGNVEYFVFSYKGRLLLGAYGGIYSLRATHNGDYKFIRDPVYWPLTKNSQIFRASQFGNNLICYQKYRDRTKNKAVEKITLMERTADSKKIRTIKINHLGDLTPNLITYDSLTKAVFICSNEGLYILTDGHGSELKKFNLFLRRLQSKTDTIIENSSTLSDKIQITYEQNDISALIGFTSYETSSAEFCYKLEGKDESFSKWTKESKLTFSNLREKDYVLKIKARTELEDIEYTLDIPFRILPPWYRSLFAYVVYIILFISFIYYVVKLNSKRLIALNKKLEQTIEERTSTISAQKEELEHKQTEILDSINYAQRIQRALLASDKILKENLPDYFVFFQPKDVVSGDFYWASLLSNNLFALVTADSTGHGVPGAIMSMLNISCLKESVEAEKLTTPNNILNHTRRKVIETLANDGSAEGGKDGMDCSLVAFDFNNNQIQIAAANNPVWIIRNVSSSSEAYREVIEIKPDKMPVGKHDKDQESFSLKTVDILKGDLIYTLTDGFPDQFGGDNGKKFMSKKLKELLLSISHLSMLEQKNSLTNIFDKWKGDLEQVDDVCLIGIKV
ncbi:SpoIIE family protein phosphatase [Aurantibacillus circumpalustris]|uniref:SpoIIE family protein phosphatase n=1 Tax=Aurantibacillus circumpalustris TaxID=3036359 RepID=UPI00295A6B45|nr:SpoIIE family protein phosphatase [Aurantibacillus circumpalustris]